MSKQPFLASVGNRLIIFSFLSSQIELKIRKGQSGLGSGATMSVDSVSITRSKSQKNWEKARERFADSCQPDVLSPKTQTNTSPKAWVRAEETTNTQPEVDTQTQI